jgi:uncharacterized protein (DUF952 family)
MPNPDLVYKAVTEAGFAQGTRDGHFLGAGIDLKDGFIHLSTAGQVAETLNLYYRGVDHLLLLAVRTADLGADLRWEASRGGALFPHLYVPLPLSAVDWKSPIAVAADGSCALPAALR